MGCINQKRKLLISTEVPLTTIFRLQLVWFTFLLNFLDPDFSISVVMQLSHCLKRRTSVNHLYQATSLVVSPANHSAYECLQAVRFILLSHFCGFNQNQFIYILVAKGDFSVKFTKTQKMPFKNFRLLISIENSMAYTFYSCKPDDFVF